MPWMYRHFHSCWLPANAIFARRLANSVWLTNNTRSIEHLPRPHGLSRCVLHWCCEALFLIEVCSDLRFMIYG